VFFVALGANKWVTGYEGSRYMQEEEEEEDVELLLLCKSFLCYARIQH
jgi:hypothetical protein